MPERRHGNYPTIGFAVVYSLGNVCNGDEAEEDGVEVSGRDGGTEGPEGVLRGGGGACHGG